VDNCKQEWGFFCISIYYIIYHKFCPSLYRYGWVGGLIVSGSWDGPDVSGRYKEGVLAPGRDKGGPLRGRIAGMGGLGRVRIIYICTHIHTYIHTYTYTHTCIYYIYYIYM
jgi:hypothetical protein